jgi:hypothetical protein
VNEHVEGWDPNGVIPNPGSLEAQAMGCDCPRFDNNRGIGIKWDGKRSWYMSMICEVHKSK